MNEQEMSDARMLPSGELYRVAYAKLLREAARVSVGDWVMAEADERGKIHDAGRVALVEAAGWTMAAWERLPPLSEIRSTVLLHGAMMLGVSTEWGGWE